MTPALRLTQAVLIAEAVWHKLLPGWMALLAFLTAGMLGVWEQTPFWPHTLALLALVAFWAFWVVRWRRQGVVWPTAADARRALDRRSGVTHRPNTHLADTPAHPLTDAAARLWWRARRQARRARGLWPVGPLTRRHAADPFGLRYALLAAFCVSLLVPGATLRARDALWPVPKMPALANLTVLDLTLTPPAYTAEPPRLVESGVEPAPVLAGTRLSVTVHRREPLWRRVWLTVGDQSVPLTDTNGTLTAALDLSTTAAYELSYLGVPLQGGVIPVVADRAPAVRLTAPLARTREGSFRLSFDSTDDVGLATVAVMVEVAGHSLSSTLATPPAGTRLVSDTTYADFSSTPAAGREVTLRLQATDVSGQVTESDPLRVTVPLRPFTHPVAKKLVELRGALLVDPTSIGPIGEGLTGLLDRPQAFGHDVRAYLSMTMAREALSVARERAAERAADLMWDAALRIDRGPLAGLLTAAQEARRKLEQALSEGASADEVAQRLEALAQAMKDILGRMDSRNVRQEEGGLPRLQSGDLAHLMERLQSLIANGANTDAQRLLNDLEDILANVSGDDAGLKELGDLMQRLDAAADAQRTLVEKGIDPFIRDHVVPLDAPAQSALKADVEKLTRKFAELGLDTAHLDDATQAMEAALSLGRQGHHRDAHQRQAAAAQALQQARGDMVRQLLQKMYGGMDNMQRDPSGRLHMSGDAAVPDTAPETLSRRIRDELFDRADDLSRPAHESDYLKRLLERF